MEGKEEAEEKPSYLMGLMQMLASLLTLIGDR